MTTNDPSEKGPPAEPSVELLAWDSSFWGVRAARIRATDRGQLPDVEDQAKQLQVEWASLLVPTEGTDLISAAIRLGYDLVDVRLSLRARQPVDRRHLRAGELCRLASLDDVEAVASIAQTAFAGSRFYIDGHLDTRRCGDFYETWARNSFDGQMADAVVVSTHNGHVDGFVTVRFDADGSANLPLVAVRHDRRGAGTGRSLMAHVLQWISDGEPQDVTVVTQLSNIRAIGLYESAGFKMEKSAVWLHKWTSECINAPEDI